MKYIDSPKNNYLLLVGIFLGFSTLFKQPGAIVFFGFLIFLAIYLLTSKVHLNFIKNLTNILFFIAGFIAPLLIVSAYFFLKHSFHEFLFDTLLININYPANSFKIFLKNSYNIFWVFPLIWVLSFNSVISVFKNFINNKYSIFNKEGLLFILLILVLLPTIAKQYSHYYFPVLFPASILSYKSIKLLSDFRESNDNKNNSARIMFAILIIALFLPTIYSTLRVESGLNNQFKVAGVVESSFRSPDDTILIIGTAPEIYFLTNKEPQIKYIYFLPINIITYPNLEHELVKIIDEKKITIIVIFKNDINNFEYLYNYIHKDYKLFSEFNDLKTNYYNIKIYRIKDQSNDESFYDEIYKTNYWWDYPSNPVLSIGQKNDWDSQHVYDPAIIFKEGIYHMWYSGRDGINERIGYANSTDGIFWKKYTLNPVLDIGNKNSWDNVSVDRPSVVIHNNTINMWYTGFIYNGKVLESRIGYAVSKDGLNWKKYPSPILNFTEPWEKFNVQCPNVIFDENDNLFKMWYSGGEQYEPDEVGYAYSKDGINWTKYDGNPIFKPGVGWEEKKIGSFQVVKINYTYYAFYNAFDRNVISRIGMAKSKDGINWVRNPGNPIIIQGMKGSWNDFHVYKPIALFNENKWLLWYNARGSRERIGISINYNNI